MKMRNLFTLAILGLFMVSAVIAFAGDKSAGMKGEAEMASAKIGHMAPDFTLMGADGKEYSLSDLKGKFVVLEWINFDCPYVKKHYGENNIPKKKKKYTDKGVVWFSICSSAPGKQGNFTGDALKSKMSGADWSATAYLVDADGTVGKKYGAKTTPHMFVINPKGELIYAGGLDNQPTPRPTDISSADNYVSMALDAAMSGKSVKTPVAPPYGCGVKYATK